jgi:hypothetical protein
MLALALVAVVGAAPAPIVLVSFDGPQGDRAAQRFAQKLATGGGLEVYARSANGLLQCGEGGSCRRAPADAPSATVTALGTITPLGARFTATVKLLDAVSARALFASAFGAASEEALFEGLDEAARRARGELGAGPKVPDAPLVDQAGLPERASAPMGVATPVERATDWRPFTVMGAGLVAFGASTYFFLQAFDAQAKLDAIERHPGLVGNAGLVDEARAQANRGKTNVTLGWTSAGVGAAAVAGGVAWLLLADRQDASALLIPAPGGAAAVVAGTFP